MDKIPPHSLESEQSILGSILKADGTTQRVREAVDLLRPEMFFQHSHRLIFSTMLEMKLSEIDLVTLEDKLKSKGALDEAGGFAYLATLAKNTPSSKNIIAYTDVVRDRFQAREIIGFAHSAIEQKYDGDGNQEVLDNLNKNLSLIDMTGTYEPMHIKDGIKDMLQRLDDKQQQKVSACRS